jgi:tetratricopeptide (TPR) repeat protein
MVLRQQKKLAEAEQVFRNAIALKPDLVIFHYDLGTTLSEHGRHSEAEAAYRKAIELKPDLALAYFSLGVALMEQARFHEAAAPLQKAAELLPAGDPRRERVRQQQQQRQRYVILDGRLPAILSGKETPADAAEHVEFARLCYHKKLYAAAARLYVDGFALTPDLAEDPDAGRRYDAACSAALAGCGRGSDGVELGDDERAHRRAQARQWLRADLDAWAKKLESGPAQDRARSQEVLVHWRDDPDLAGVRDAGALEKLPAAERPDWLALWSDLDTLLQRARSAHPK